MSERDRKKLEQMLAFHSAPTLLGVKCANLFAVKQSELSLSDVEEYFREIPVSVRILCRCRERAMLYVYQRELLEMWLADERVSAFLEKCGYAPSLTTEQRLDLLEQRISCTDFPHEIGIFLGYPVDDVVGFIENGGANYLFCGFWKVYSEPGRARSEFEKYVYCRNYLCNRVNSGVGLRRAVENFRR